MTEIVQESPQPSNAGASSVALPGISGGSDPEQTSGATEVVIDVHEAAAHFNNNPYGSQLRLFGHHTSIVEREIDKIFTWQSKRINFIDPTRQSEISSLSKRQVTSDTRHIRFRRKVDALIQKIRGSTYYLLMKYILLAAPISAIYMGASSKYFCPISEVTPYMLQLIGVFSIFLILFRIATAFKNQFSNQTLMVFEYVSIGLCWCLGVALCIEMIPFYNLHPDFENIRSPNYCHKTFYYYTFYMNIAALVIGCLALVMHVPCLNETAGIAYIRMG